MAEDDNKEEPKKIRIAPEGIEIGEEEGFEGHDLFGYAKFGETLGNIFLQTLGLRVVLLDDEWGTGKTVFVKQWAGHMRQRKAKVIYIDAFENDYQSDPFLMIVTELTAKLQGTDATSDLLEAGAKAVGSILSSAIALNTAGLVDADKIFGLFEEKLNQSENEKKDLIDFREKLKSIADEDGQIIIVIDELDRCRPDFALRLLERVKHLFDVEGVTFLLVASSNTLIQMVKHAYGFDDEPAVRYLDKFMNLRASLPKRLQGMSQNRQEIYAKHLAKTNNDDDPLSISRYNVYSCLGAFAQYLGAELGTIEKIYFNFIAVCLSEGFSIGLRNFVITLCVVKVIAPEEFSKILKEGECDWHELEKVFNLDIELEDRETEQLWPIFHILIALFAPENLLEWSRDNRHNSYVNSALERGFPVPSGDYFNRKKMAQSIAEIIEDINTFSS